MAKEFTYRGKTTEELQKLTIEEFAKLLPARERRKITRGFTEQEQKAINTIKLKDNAETHRRDLIILPIFVGKTIKIHTGREFLPIKILPEMIGHRLGEFALTRRKVQHSSPGIGATKSSASMSVR